MRCPRVEYDLENRPSLEARHDTADDRDCGRSWAFCVGGMRETDGILACMHRSPLSPPRTTSYPEFSVRSARIIHSQNASCSDGEVEKISLSFRR